jgi:hypothetical protein
MLWQSPVPQIDFNGITADLVLMKSLAQSNGIYLGDSGAQGYHVIFNSNGTFDVYRVNSAGDGNWAYSNMWGWEQEYSIINSETYLQSYTPSSDCGLIFIEDNLWLEGTVKGKATIVSADLVDVNRETDIILVNDIEYSTLIGTDGLTAIAEEDVIISPKSPDDMTIRGIFVAQTGRFGRNYYGNEYGWAVADVFKDSLTINGTIVSNGRVGTKWNCGSWCSGYNIRYNSYDRTQANNPPPLTPYTSNDFRFIQWKEEAL